MTTPPYVGLSSAEMKAESIVAWLTFWETNKGIKDRRVAELCQRKFNLSRTALRHLHDYLDPAVRISIRTGTDRITAGSFPEGIYNFYSQRPVVLEPGTVIPFEHMETMQWTGERDPVLHVGSASVLLTLPTLAETFRTGGSMNARSVRQPTSVQTLSA